MPSARSMQKLIDDLAAQGQIGVPLPINRKKARPGRPKRRPR
jgi:hypothetical protein